MLLPLFLLLALSHASSASQASSKWGFHLPEWPEACPDYRDYSTLPHPPYSEGPLSIPYQRPPEECRYFRSQAVEKLINQTAERMVDKDLARLFENAYPNTLDTTVRWHLPSIHPQGPASFIVTGDINAQWLRDSTNQLSQYQRLAREDPFLRDLILGAINTQAEFVRKSPYCNAFQPPEDSGLAPTSNGQDDEVSPAYEPTVVFECKWEVDSLAAFLSLGNQYYEATHDRRFVNEGWLKALEQLLIVLDEQSVGTFHWDGSVNNQVYRFQRRTTLGTETLNLGGIGNPIASNTSLIRSSFRPSDDASILPFFIPGNAYLSVELGRTAELMEVSGKGELADALKKRSDKIKEAIYKHAVVDHPVFGKVFAYETDGYGSHIFMDDANLPSLLSLPLLGFVDVKDPIYQNTRKMVLSSNGNPYYLSGPRFSGIGGPHVGIEHAWPMSVLVQILTEDDDAEIKRLLEMVKGVSKDLGLVHESENVRRDGDYTRSWFAWANSVFAEVILDLKERKPHLLFGDGKGNVAGGK